MFQQNEKPVKDFWYSCFKWFSYKNKAKKRRKEKNAVKTTWNAELEDRQICFLFFLILEPASDIFFPLNFIKIHFHKLSTNPTICT